MNIIMCFIKAVNIAESQKDYKLFGAVGRLIYCFFGFASCFTSKLNKITTADENR
jgi:hypothetical protein